MSFTYKKVLFFITVLCLILSTPAFSDPNKIFSDGIMLQSFGWNSQSKGFPSHWYRLISQRVDSIKKLGVNMIWLPPVSRSVSPQGYFPGDYYDLGTADLPTFYGNIDTLTETLNKLNENKIFPIADIVINHRCAGKQDENGIWNVYHFASNKASWEKWAVCKGEYGGTGNPDSGENYSAAPDIDHSSPQVQKDISDWLNWLKKLGFRGWRYDFAKGYSAKYAGIYNTNSKIPFSVSEIWTNMAYQGSYLQPNQNAHRQALCDWIDASKSPVACTFDFTTKGVLQVAVNGEYWRLKDSSGKPSGLIGWWPSRAVTFLDNHDTGSQQGHWPFPGDKVMQGYAYILTHPGIPCLFWEHVYDWNLYDKIKKLVDIRKKFNIHSTSKIKILKAEDGLYSAVIDDCVAAKLGNKDWSPAAGFTLLASGEGYAVWGKTARKP